MSVEGAGKCMEMWEEVWGSVGGGAGRCGKVWLGVAGSVESVLGCGEGERKCGEGERVCWGVGEVRGDMGRSLTVAEEVSGECGWCEEVLGEVCGGCRKALVINLELYEQLTTWREVSDECEKVLGARCCVVLGEVWESVEAVGKH